jgi:DNA-binding SARP family transcriptional activator
MAAQRRHRTWDRIRAVANTLSCLGFLAGFAWFLTWLAGWPLPDHWPTSAELAAVADDPLSGPFLRNLGACAGWLFLALLALAIAVEALTRISRRRLPRLRLPAPLRALAAGVVGASIIGLLTAPAHAKTTSGPPQKPPTVTALATPPASATRAPAASSGKVTFVIHNQRYHVIVRRGDTMSKIARQWLGDPNRWPEICRLNHHRHYPAVGGTLHDCDLIYPRWDLKLPADAVPPTGAVPAHKPTPKPPAVTPPADPELPPKQPIAPTPPAPTPNPTTPATIDPDGVVNLETTPPPASAPTSVNGTATPTSSGGDHGSADTWLTYAMAAALLAAATLVTRRRLLTRRGRGEGTTRRGQGHRPLPYIASLARHLVHLRTAQPTPAAPPALDSDTTTSDEQIDAGPPEPAEPRVLGLHGEGAPAAARAAIIAALTPPAADRPPGHAITTADTLDAVFDGHAIDTTGWPNLHAARTVGEALDHLHAQILHSRRARDLAPSTDAAAPRILLVIAPPPAQHSGRLQTLLDAADANVTARILGDWPISYTVAIDGATGSGGPRQPVLTIPDALDALNLVREATIGPATAPSAVPGSQPAAIPGHDEPPTRRAGTQAASDGAGDTAVAEKATLQVLGTIQFGPERPGTRPHLRGKAKELAVYLACRPNGGDVNLICEILYPDSTVSKSLTNVQQAVSSLRKVLTYHTTLRGNPVLLTDDRYRLNPDLVDVDLWQLHQRAGAAAATTDPHQRQRHLEYATSLGTAQLAPELDNDWIDAYRVTTTITIVEAHTALADIVTPIDPQRAAALLAAAIAADPANESLYRRRMRILAQLGQADAIRATFRELSHVLANLDATPEPETLQLAHHLLGVTPTPDKPGQPSGRTGPPTQKLPVTPTARR